MKKSLVLVMALVLVVAFAFADQTATVTLGLDKGVVTAGDPITVSFNLVVENVAEDVTTIEVMGDEVADNVFVMLIKDLPNDDATYEARKVVDDMAMKTTYFIKAKELPGDAGVFHAHLVDWYGNVVEGQTFDVPFSWKGNHNDGVILLTPPTEGLYNVVAYIKFDEETQPLELQSNFGGSADIIALDDYVKAAGIDGLTPVLDPAVNTLQVSAGVEFMYAKAAEELGSQAEDYTYLGVYGEGSQSAAPSVIWTYNPTGKPGFESVELHYIVRGSGGADDGDFENPAKCTQTDTAYIKFLVMSANFDEGDCCATSDDMKWGLWFAIGTGEYHGWSKSLRQSFEFHVLDGGFYDSCGWTIVKGAECRGWIKAIFYLDPSDIEIWLYAILGTDYCYVDTGNQSATVEGNPDSIGYKQNFLETAELNVIADIIFKKMLNITVAVLDIPVTKDPETTQTKLFAAANMVLDADPMKITIGAEYFASDMASMTESYTYEACLILEGLDLRIPNFIFIEALSNVRLGAFLYGDQDGIQEMNLYSCFGLNQTCCNPPIKLGMILDWDTEERVINLDQIYMTYGHEIGQYGPVTLDGNLGVIYSLGSTAIDGGQYGQGVVSGSDSRWDWAVGVGYEVTGTMTW